MSRVCIMSLWRNDAERSLESRVAHLGEKAQHTDHDVSYLWLVGDTTDTTTRDLINAGKRFPQSRLVIPVDIYESESGVGPGEDTPTCRRRSSSNANAMFAAIPEDADYVLLHESDIQSPPDLIDNLLGGPPLPCAAWPVLELDGRDQFYDVWAFKDLDDNHFIHHPPHGRGWSEASPFQVNSFGTVWMAPAAMVRGRIISDLCVVDLCEQWRAEGHQLWCDPRIVVRQPAALWVPS